MSGGHTLNAAGDPMKIEPIRARLQRLPVESAWADAIVMSDVIEHIFRGEIADVLAECHRVLKPGGRLVVHTQPNRVLVDYTVP